jgi:hypothetical protein
MSKFHIERLNLCYFGDTLMTEEIGEKCEVGCYLLDECSNPVIKVTDVEKGESSAPMSCYVSEIEIALTLAKAIAKAKEMT